MQSSSTFALWTWPYDYYGAGIAMAETMAAAPLVVEKRLPVIWAALINPWAADLGELSLMASEKGSAFARSGDHLKSIGRALASANAANARDVAHWLGGSMLWPADWWRIAESNLALFASLASLPGQAIAPIHHKVMANVHRLRS
jgi:hypothetical protein